jgi:hypothetical protein
MSHKDILIYEWAMKKSEFWTEINLYVFYFSISDQCACRVVRSSGVGTRPLYYSTSRHYSSGMQELVEW